MHDDYNDYDGFWAGYCDDRNHLGNKVSYETGFLFGLIASLVDRIEASEERITELEKVKLEYLF